MIRSASLVAFLALALSASQANACFPRCTQFFARIFGQPQPANHQQQIELLIQNQGPNQAIALQDAPLPPPNNQIQIDLQGGNQAPDLQIAVRDVQLPAQIELNERDIKLAFNWAFEDSKIQFRDVQRTYRLWKETIHPARPDADEPRRLVYRYEPGRVFLDPPSARSFGVRASLHTDDESPLLTVQYTWDYLKARDVGRELGLPDADTRASLLARAFPAFGGRQGVHAVRGRWPRGHEDLREFWSVIHRKAGELEAAEHTDIATFAKDLYGFTPMTVTGFDDPWPSDIEIIYAPPGAARRDEARDSANNTDDEKEKKGDF